MLKLCRWHLSVFGRVKQLYQLFCGLLLIGIGSNSKLLVSVFSRYLLCFRIKCVHQLRRGLLSRECIAVELYRLFKGLLYFFNSKHSMLELRRGVVSSQRFAIKLHEL